MPTTNATAAPTILLVEDEENDVVFMKMAMEHAGITNTLQVAEDGGQAIEYLSGNGGYADRRRHPLPALVLLDLKLPRVMGMDVLKWIRERREFDLMVVIILTSSQQRSDIELTASLHANSYLLKPSNPLDLNELAALLKQYWLQLKQPTATLGVQAAAAAPR
jgi:CheY-like chemotaxis protein